MMIIFLYCVTSIFFGKSFCEFAMTEEKVKAILYLFKYCYIGDCEFDATDGSELTALNMTELKFERALKDFQRMANLPATGELNQETIEKMSVPRCGMPDHKHPFSGPDHELPFVLREISFSYWTRHELANLKYNIMNYPRSPQKEEVDMAIERAFSEWAKVIPMGYSRIHHRQRGVAHIDIMFVRGSHADSKPFDGPYGDLAHAFLPSGTILGGDIHYDNDEMWGSVKPGQNESDINFFDIYTVGLHEIGHSLGLSHLHSPGAVMYPLYSMNNTKLTQEDIRYVTHFYGERSQGTGVATSSLEVPSVLLLLSTAMATHFM